MIENSWILPNAGYETDLVRIAGLCVKYSGRWALQDVHLRVPRGEIFGLLGPNGAGKTTLFRVLATLLVPSRGEVELCGKNVRGETEEIREVISYMPDMAALPSDLKVVEYLRFFAETYGMRGKDRDHRVAECLDSVGLSNRAKDYCNQLSLGMRQRLVLAKSVIHRPSLLILDEPASGLDPMARADLKKALRRQAEEGSTVILSSHVTAEIEDICTSIGLLRCGRLLEAGPVRKVLARFAPTEVRVEVRAPGRRDEAARWLRKLPGATVGTKFQDEDTIELVLDEDRLNRAALFSLLGSAGLGITGMQVIEPTVEEVLMRLATSEQNP